MKKIILILFKFLWLICLYIYKFLKSLQLKYKIFLIVLIFGISYIGYRYYEMKEAERYSNDMYQNIMDGESLEELEEEVLRAS